MAWLEGGLRPWLLEVLRVVAKLPHCLCLSQQPMEAEGAHHGGVPDAVAMLVLSSHFQIADVEPGHDACTRQRRGFVKVHLPVTGL